MSARDLYPVIETFTSIQGEGTRIGRRSTFVRLAHCNLSCAWCDTKYSWKKGEMVEPTKLTPQEIAAKVTTPDVVLTGGEPLMHDLGPLLAQVYGRFITVETNATLFRPDVRVSLWSLSPKLGSSGMTPDLDVIRRFLNEVPERTQLKFVINGAEDLAAVKALLAQLPEVEALRLPVILQPVGVAGQGRDAYCDRMAALIEEQVLHDPYWEPYQLQFLPQFHRLLWQDARGI